MTATVANPVSIDTVAIRKVGVIGAGQMGTGIANVCAAHGFDVVLGDISHDQIDKALGAISANYDRQIRRNRMTEAQKRRRWRASRRGPNTASCRTAT